MASVEYASKGLANGIGIPALTLGSLAFLGQLNNGNGGILGGLFGNGNTVGQMAAVNALAEKDAIIAKLKAENYSDKVAKEVYTQSALDNKNLSDRLIDKYISPMAQEIADRRVSDARLEERINCMAKTNELQFAAVYKEIECTKKECGAAIALESERRMSGDNNLMCYVNATFVPGKLVMPRESICPEVMQRYNSWVAPTDTAPATQPVTGTINAQ